jgi:thiosulfate/3-mercaptopyruvate sulfurtransferase
MKTSSQAAAGRSPMPAAPAVSPATDPEPRAGMRSGHMPGAKSLPSGSFFANGKFKSLSELQEDDRGCRYRPLQACRHQLRLGRHGCDHHAGAESLGHTDNTLYDGSWSEWGSRDDTPVVTGKELMKKLIDHGKTPESAQGASPPGNDRTAEAEPAGAGQHPDGDHARAGNSAAFYRFLYPRSGALALGRSAADERRGAAAILRDKRTHDRVLYVNGAPAGFYEYLHDEDTVELSHFGLFEHALGLGIGKWFLLQTLYAAWTLNPKKVRHHQQSRSSPRALQLYQMFGFSPVSTGTAIVRPLSDKELLEFARKKR